MAQKKAHGLGRGLDSLFPTDFSKLDVLGPRPASVSEIEIVRITAKKDQPRRTFDDDKISQLSVSIKEHGVIQPIVLVEISVGNYTIIAGERRYRAAKMAGLKTIPAIVRNADELQQLEMALVENIQREDLNAIEQAISIKRLHEEFSQSYESIARRLGKAETTVVNLSRLLGLPAPYQQALQDKKMSEGHARALLALSKNPEAQNILFQHILGSDWSVRKAELFVQAHKDTSASKNPIKHLQAETKETKLLSKKLAAEVRIQRSAKGGKLTIAFRSDEDLNRLMKLL